MKFKEIERTLKEIEVPESDFPQIKAALRRTIFYTYDNNGILVKTDASHAYFLIGKTLFASGLARSSFHQSAARKAENGAFVLFDSSALFR